MLDEFTLHIDAIEEHGREGNDDHLLVDLRDLRQRLKDARNNLVLDDLLLAVFLH